MDPLSEKHRYRLQPHQKSSLCIETGHGKKIGLLRIRGKNKKQRALFVVDRLFEELTRYLAHPQSPKNKRAALFPAQPDTAISNNRLQNIVKQHAQKAGIKARVTPRALRHSFATEMYHQNVPLNAILKINATIAVLPSTEKSLPSEAMQTT